MAGELVPLVLLPRFTTLAGLMDSGPQFTTTAIDVSAYQQILLTVYRGLVMGTNPAHGATPTPCFKIWIEQSSDQETWVAEGPDGFDPGAVLGGTGDKHYGPGQSMYALPLTRRWLRFRVSLFNANNVATCYATGFLEKRLT